MSKFHNDRSRASDALALDLSLAKLRRLQPELFGWRSWFYKSRWGLRQLSAKEAKIMLAEHMQLGDTRAAIVARLQPLLVGAYTDEQDAVLLLRFPDWMRAQYDPKVDRRLLTVNTYASPLTILIVP